MAGKGGVYSVILLVIAAFAVAGCYLPSMAMGTIGEGLVSSKTSDGLQVQYTKSAYTIDELFYPGHLSAFAVKTDGTKRELSLTEYEIRVIENPASEPNRVSAPVTTSGYEFQSTGEKAIQVTYNRLSIQYRVNVSASGTAGNQSSGIIVEWE